jgi:nucleotide-binding universal stress UspA family protein
MEVKADSCTPDFNAETCYPLERVQCDVGVDIMDRILVALDGSTHSNRALDLAADLAEKYQAELLLVHVMPTAPLDESERHMAAVEYADELSSWAKDWSETRSGEQSPSGPELLLRYGDLAGRFRELVAKRLMSSAESKLKKRQLRSTASILQTGDPAKTILDLAKSRGVDAIVIGSRGLGEISGLLMGSVSHKVNQLANCICVTVK